MAVLISDPTSVDRLDFIDSLRGFAAFYIVLYHLALLPDPDLRVPRWASELVLTGGTGVTLFFIISAFTLFLTMDRRNHEPIKILSFYIRRFFRIAPLFYVLLLLSLFRDWYLYNHLHSINKIFLNIFFGFNFFPGYYEGIVWASWILGVQMIFYLLFPIIYRYVNNIWKAVSFFFITLFIAQQFEMFLSYFGMKPELKSSFNQMSFLHQLPVFAIGIFTYFLYRNFIKNRHLPKAIGIGLMLFSCYCYMALLSGRLQVLFDSLYWQGLIYSCFLLGISITQPIFLVNKFTIFLGKISYSLYLNHPTLIVLLASLFAFVYKFALLTTIQYGICFVVVAALLICISTVSYKFVEKPSIGLGKKLIHFMKL